MTTRGDASWWSAPATCAARRSSSCCCSASWTPAGQDGRPAHRRDQRRHRRARRPGDGRPRRGAGDGARPGPHGLRRPAADRPRWWPRRTWCSPPPARHRGEVATLHPRALRYIFALRDFADLAAAPRHRAGWTPRRRSRRPGLQSVVRAVAARRGLEPPLEATEADVVDPFRREDELFVQMADQVSRAGCRRSVRPLLAGRAVRAAGPRRAGAVRGSACRPGSSSMSSLRSATERSCIRGSSTMSMDPPTGLVPNPLNGAVMNTMSLPRMFLIPNACERRSATEKSLSSVRFLVPASMKLARVTGLVRVSLDSALEHQRLDERLLAPAAGDVALAELVALADERQRLGAVEVVPALGDAGAGLLGVDPDPADGVGHRLEALEADQPDVVDRHVDQVLDGADQQRRAAVGVGRVDLVLAVPGDRDVEVAREVDQVDLGVLLVDVHEDDDVGATAGDAGPAVRADQQDVLGRTRLRGPWWAPGGRRRRTAAAPRA